MKGKDEINGWRTPFQLTAQLVRYFMRKINLIPASKNLDYACEHKAVKDKILYKYHTRRF